MVRRVDRGDGRPEVGDARLRHHRSRSSSRSPDDLADGWCDRMDTGMNLDVEDQPMSEDKMSTTGTDGRGRTPDLHARLLVEVSEWGDGNGRFNLCVDCGATGCPLCNGTGWRDSQSRHLRAVDA